MTSTPTTYPASLDVEYPEGARNRATTFFRVILAIPILAVISGLTSLVFLPVLLMLLFREKYPRWWFDWNLEYQRFSQRVGAYLLLLRDEYPSTDEAQAVHLDVVYPASGSLNRWLPLVKWLLLLPHYIVLSFLFVALGLVTLCSWFAILVTGRYPHGLFRFAVGVQRWMLRVMAYGFLLTTDQYPPFSTD